MRNLEYGCVNMSDASASFCSTAASVLGALAGRKKPRLFSRGFLCLRYLFSRLGQAIVLPRQVSGGHMPAAAAQVTYKKKKNQAEAWFFCVCVTYFHGQSPGNYRRRTCA